MEEKENALTALKRVHLMAEYGTEGVWIPKMGPCPADYLPVSSATLAMIRGWQAWFEFAAACKESRWFDEDAHAAFGLFIARIVKSQLPDWTITATDWRATGHTGEVSLND